MRLIKLAGIAAVVTTTAVALVGVSSAIAGNTALCEQHEEPCAAANIYQGHFQAVAANPKFLTNVADISCEKSRILGFALGLANPHQTHLEALIFTGDCLTAMGNPCVIESTELGLLLLLRTALNLASLTADNTRVLISCPGAAIHCVYNLPAMHVLGSPNANSLAEIHAVEAPMENGEGMFCPGENSFDALYKITQPDPIAITG